MNQNKLAYFEKEDILHLSISSDEPEGGSVEISPNITAELNDKGELIGIEILNASSFIRDSILESVQAKNAAAPERLNLLRFANPVRGKMFIERKHPSPRNPVRVKCE